MSKTLSGTSSHIISLPQGGGALHGIGEQFSPDQYTGTGNLIVPIALPPGRNGFQPQLNLVYSTGNGNGSFGLGWSLSIPGVSRKTSQGIPVYDDMKDIFLLSGAEDLVPIFSEPSETTNYRPRTEGPFAHILHHRNASNDYWEVRSKDGFVSLYGTPEATGNNPAVIAKPTDRSHIFAWKLTRATDPFGNCIEYVYEQETRTDGPHQCNQVYLSQIRYIDYGDPTNPQFLVTVHFNYEDRPDPFSDYRAGFEIRTVRRCTSIEVSTHLETDLLTRTYHLIYLDQPGLPREAMLLNGVSLLRQIQIEGHNGNKSEQLPPLKFGYSGFEPEEQIFLPITGSELPPLSLTYPNFELNTLMQKCAQYQLIQKELSETIARSMRLSSVMQEKIDSITSLLRVLLTKEQAQHIADASAVPTLAELSTEKPRASSPTTVKEDLPPTFSATCLRPFAVEIGNKPVVLCSNRNGQAILRYLVAQPNHSATTDTLMDILWPEDEADVSSRKLQVTMSILRRSLNNSHERAPNDGYILYKQHAYQLNPSILLHIDVDDFLALYHAGNRADGESAIGYYERACHIYSRPFLVEDIYADWSFIRREQLRQIHIDMCTALAEHYLAAHTYSKAAHWATVIIEENRCDEVAYRLLMKAYALDGRRGDALRQFQHCQEVMRAELGMQPVSETKALYQAIVNGEITPP
jgi:DNA-binding SARP family transcriptional activator